MFANEDQELLQICLRDMQARLNWGDSRNWSNYDFEKLSDLILDDTGVHLSVSTLKRIWGKVPYNNAPSLTTLNTLARFLGSEDWRTYKQKFGIAEMLALAQPPVKQPERAVEIRKDRGPSKRVAGLYSLFGIGLFALLIGFITLSDTHKKITVADLSKFSFSANKVVTEGVPNSVLFTYDASAARSDSNYIVQTWDLNRKTLVSKSKHHHSAIYYYPGYFKTKLIADGEIVKTHDLMITSDGWLCLAEDDPVPLYFRKEEYLKSDRIEVDKKTLVKYNLTLHPKPRLIRFFNQRDLGNLRNDNFVFETKVKNEFSQGTGACQFVQVLIQCKDDIIIIPLSAKTCIGNIRLYAAGKEMNSVDADLSKFGCDLSRWTTLRVETEKKHMKFIVNGIEACSFTFPNDPTGIVGLQYRFNGVGAVKDTWFKTTDKIYDFGPR